MKNLLIASTALVAIAGMAAADNKFEEYGGGSHINIGSHLMVISASTVDTHDRGLTFGNVENGAILAAMQCTHTCCACGPTVNVDTAALETDDLIPDLANGDTLTAVLSQSFVRPLGDPDAEDAATLAGMITDDGLKIDDALVANGLDMHAEDFLVDVAMTFEVEDVGGSGAIEFIVPGAALNGNGLDLTAASYSAFIANS